MYPHQLKCRYAKLTRGMNRFLLTTICMLVFSYSYAQKLAIKTNVLYGAATYTPNLALEYGLGDRTTINISGGYNPWNLNNNLNKGYKLAHWVVQPEFRYWSCERFNGHFFGVHATYSIYNIGGKKLPMLFGKDSEKYRYKGSAYGGGFTYGYLLNITPRFALEFEIGAGYLHLNYDQYYAFKCGSFIKTDSRNYFGITKMGATLVFNLF